MRGDHPCFIGDAKGLERRGGVLHGFPIAGTAHDDANLDRSGTHALSHSASDSYMGIPNTTLKGKVMPRDKGK